MVEKGISVYTGLGYSIDDNMSYLRQARDLGFTRVFTSLHIPEADQQSVFAEFKVLVNYANEIGLKVTADVSRRSFDLVFNHISDVGVFLKKIGLHTVRLDYGFDLADISRLINQTGLHVELNASTIRADYLEKMVLAEIDLTKVEACHNYYPRPETGLSYELFKERSELLQRYNIPVAAFIPSAQKRRGPVFAGLPTLEMHRYISPSVAAKQLIASNLVRCIIFGDPLVTKEELEQLSHLNANCLMLALNVEPETSIIEQCVMFKASHVNRLDPGAFAIRSTTARGLYQASIPARKPLPRPRGSITIDNEKYGRYMGELQITLVDLPADERVNVVGTVSKADMLLLDYIAPGMAFSLSAQ